MKSSKADYFLFTAAAAAPAVIKPGRLEEVNRRLVSMALEFTRVEIVSLTDLVNSMLIVCSTVAQSYCCLKSIAVSRVSC
jgi:hypothetical protein